jgi:protein associated with RNAse G/E
MNSPSPSTTVTIIKRDPSGAETWRYSGKVVKRANKQVTIEAYFDREDMLFHGMWLCKDDRFIETYFEDRWYNIFEIHDRTDDSLKGWYCNISTPAVIEDHAISYKDLALDLLVFPDGEQLILDEDEFQELDISPQMRDSAQAALEDLLDHFVHLLR